MSKIIWFTGISGAGKSTLSLRLFKKFSKKYRIKIIDGDIVRKRTKNKNTFTKLNIYKNNVMIIKLINKIYKNYDIILVAVISPLLKTRSMAKKLFKEKYFEVHVKCKIKTLIKRDTKKLYNKAINTGLKVIGYNSEIKYEKSKYQVIEIDTDKLNISNSLKKIIKLTNI